MESKISNLFENQFPECNCAVGQVNSNSLKDDNEIFTFDINTQMTGSMNNNMYKIYCEKALEIYRY
jgi:hypothetical protein